MKSFKAFRIHEIDGGVRAGFEQVTIDDLTKGEVVVRVEYSDVNYKDALAATGKGRILRRSPLNGGIDLAGTVVSSDDPAWRPGQAVLVAGCGLSETIDGGYAEYARVPSCCLVAMPDGLDAYRAMALGTAGFTAALAVIRMEQLGQNPDMGEVVVTGATGGVGSVAIDLLASRGYRVAALSGKPEQEDYLRAIGASRIIDRNTLDTGKRPMEKATWGGAVDNLGGEVLTWLTRTVRPFGNIASVGLAADYRFNTTVMPFILRGVSVIGINSIEMPAQLRERGWKLLAESGPGHLERMVSRVVDFDELPGVFDAYIAGSVTGRTVVRIAS